MSRDRPGVPVEELSLEHFRLRNCIVTCIIDSTTAESYIRKRGGSKQHLNRWAHRMHACADANNVKLLTILTPSRMNYIADSLSRFRHWSKSCSQARSAYRFTRVRKAPPQVLNQRSLRRLRAHLNVCPTIDMFGSAEHTCL